MPRLVPTSSEDSPSVQTVDRVSRPTWPASGRPSAVVLLVAVNVLNLADAFLTAIAVGTGRALEMNPIAQAMGTPGKIALVGGCSLLLYLLRPKALAIPAGALLLVLVYQLAGLLMVSPTN